MTCFGLVSSSLSSGCVDMTSESSQSGSFWHNSWFSPSEWGENGILVVSETVWSSLLMLQTCSSKSTDVFSMGNSLAMNYSTSFPCTIIVKVLKYTVILTSFSGSVSLFWLTVIYISVNVSGSSLNLSVQLTT